ncbi:MAG: hypothetical protein KAF91_29005 [Nostoc sp. TH1S01]|nr:hypothetical protein [Nostoc sp. TH1S01]
MSYYDFDDHFWSAKQVCNQSNPSDYRSNSIYINLKNILFIVFVTVWAGLLIKMLIGVSTNQLNEQEVNTDTFTSNCLMFRRDAMRQIYCSKSTNK